MTDQTQPQFGAMLREWRQRRHMSQLDLALRVDVSTRHLSYVETGRSNPSPTMINRLGEGLDLPLRERNSLFLAAGYAPAYGQRPLNSPELTSVADALRLVLDRHQPYPAAVLDRSWDVLDANASLDLLVDGCAAHLLEPPVNVLRLTLHPDGMAPRIQNLTQWRSHLLTQLQHRFERTADAGLSALLDELLTYPGGGASRRSSAGRSDLVAALHLDHRGHTLSLFSITSHIDSAADITVDEMILETFYPADQRSAELLKRTNAESSRPLDRPPGAQGRTDEKENT